MEKSFFAALLIVGGGAFVALFGIIAVSAVSTGFIFQGAMVGGLGLFWLGVFLYLLATE